MKPVIFAAPGNGDLAARIARISGGDLGEVTFRRFPDGEDYLRLHTSVAGRPVVVVQTLHRPADKALPLLFLGSAARDQGATRVGLVAPYLAFMRQDHRFHDGEGLTSAYFARLVSSTFDWLVTVDPHLHRWSALADVYSIPARVVASAPAIAAWLGREIPAPYLVGPDAESAQWVGAVAAAAGVPHTVLTKVRRGDRQVEVSAFDVARCAGRTPVILDDIISTGSTMIETIRRLDGLPPPVLVGVHAVFADGAEAALRAAGCARIVTTSTITHATNEIDVGDLVAAAAAELIRG
jgi:ribose-phosphate pyrophosphokinase